MRVTLAWHGGPSYGCPDPTNPRDLEHFDSLREARDWFAGRVGDPYTPCVHQAPAEQDGPSAWVWIGTEADPPDYPDRIMEFGPRGGVRVTRA